MEAVMTDEDRKTLQIVESLLGVQPKSEKVEKPVVGDQIQIVKRDNFEVVVEEATVKQIPSLKNSSGSARLIIW